jgi:hypothetical protein
MGGLVGTFFSLFLCGLFKLMRYWMSNKPARLLRYILRDNSLRMTRTLHVLIMVIAACVIGRL